MKSKLYPLLVLLINYYSAIYIFIGISVPLLFDCTTLEVVLFFVAYIYLFPPFLCRLFITIWGRPVGTVNSNTKIFLYWWFLTQLQILFVRLPFLEEILRFFPGLYSLWLNLWGAQVSLLTYWSPGVTLTDRYHLNIEKGVIIGGGCRLGAHIITFTNDNLQCLTLAPITIERHSVVGIHAAIGPGCRVYPQETVPAGKILKPFYQWKDGKIRRPENSG